MRLQIFSDVHLDVRDVFRPRLAPDVDAVVVAGDLCEGLDRGMRWLRRHLGDEVPIVLVAGNHEYFARVRSEERAAGIAAAREYRVAFLDDGVAMIGGVRFVGSTLWADYELYGTERRDEMMEIAGRRMMDHRRILEEPGRFITPGEALALHRASRVFLESCLAVRHDGPTVVVTHHGPHPMSLAARYREDLLSAAFISDLSPVIEEHQPALWVHGHTHVGLDYRAGATRIICNPHGYGDENPAFDPGLVVEV
ncbi:MAG: metallophosphoesterase [Hyphomicrobiaceae bacterium]|nr:metallophosphoesterase [Hyphomicrobiaceae bacterium]